MKFAKESCEVAKCTLMLGAPQTVSNFQSRERTKSKVQKDDKITDNENENDSKSQPILQNAAYKMGIANAKKWNKIQKGTDLKISLCVLVHIKILS